MMKSKNAKSYGSHCRRTSVCRTGVQLPEEIIMEILPRVPAKTLGRCKCVSKHWRDLISDPKFVKTHLSLNNRHTKALLVDDWKLEPFFVVEFDGEAGGSSGEVTATRLKLDRVDDSMQCDTVYCSYNGLVLILDLDLGFIFLNPTTLECKELPKPPVNPFYFGALHLELAYDLTTDDYKAVVIFYPNEVYVYSFKTNAWKWLQDSPFYYRCLPNLYHQPGVFLNGSFHWFGETQMSYLNESFLFQIIAFDLADETFRVVPLPSKFDVSEQDGVIDLGVVCGSLCIIWQENGSHVNRRVDVWVMNEYGVTESWTKISFYQDIAKVDRVWFLGNEEFMLISRETRAVIYNVKEQSSRHIVLPELEGNIQCTFSDSLVSYKQLL